MACFSAPLVRGAKTKAAYERYRGGFDRPFRKADIARRIVGITAAEVGVREVPPDSNRDPRGEEYQRATWLAGTGWPWCAALICPLVRQLKEDFDLPFARPCTAGAWDLERWARDGGLRLFKPCAGIRAGDIVVFTFSHIGLSEADGSGGKVATIEGNTGSGGTREGGGVYRMRRATSLVRSHIRLELR